MIYLYKISYGSFEDSSTICLTHTAKYSKNDLNKMIAEIALNYLKNEDKLFDEEDKLYFDAELNTFSTLFLCNDCEKTYDKPYIAHKLITEYGFKMLEFETEWHCEGWASLINLESWKNSRTAENNYVTTYLNNNGFKPKKDKKHVRNRKNI